LVGWLGVFGGGGVVGDVVVEALEEVADDRLDHGFLVGLPAKRLDGLVESQCNPEGTSLRSRPEGNLLELIQPPGAGPDSRQRLITRWDPQSHGVGVGVTAPRVVYPDRAARRRAGSE
jgi:hypothetical protein